MDKAITYNIIVSRPPPACYFGTRILTYYWQFHWPHPLIRGGFGVWSDSCMQDHAQSY